MTLKERLENCYQMCDLITAADMSTRKQKMHVYGQIMDKLHNSGKNSMAGQMSLFDIAGEENKSQYQIPMPDVGEFDKELMLEFEKEVLGFYVSGHPLDEYRSIIDKCGTAVTLDFFVDEETGNTNISDNREYSVGGIIDGVNLKITKNNENMAFVTLLDTLGTVEVIVFPKTFEKYRRLIYAGSKVLIKGRAQLAEDEGKLIASEITSLDDVLVSEKQKNTEVWILFEDMDDYKNNEINLGQLLMDHKGFAPVYVQLKKEKKGMRLVHKVDPDSGVIDALKLEYGIDRVISRNTKS